MPQHKQPQSLRGMAVEQVAKMAFHAFVVVEAKHELCEWSASLQKEVSGLQEFFLSNIQPLWDDVCQVICDMYILKESKDMEKQFKLDKCDHSLCDIRVLTSLMIHDRIKKLTLTCQLCSKFRVPTCCFSKNQIKKLKSIEKLDFQDNTHIKITDMFVDMIGSTCKHLNEIHMSLYSSNVTVESLHLLLNCQELEYVDISGLEENLYEPLMIKLLTDLPKLKGMVVDMKILPSLTSFTSLEHLNIVIVDAEEFNNTIKFCPNVKYLNLNIVTQTHVERKKVQTLLGECSFALKSLKIVNFTFDQSMSHLLQLKGKNLTKLILEECQEVEINLDNIHVIGINCPKLEVLSVCETSIDHQYRSLRSPILPPETLIVTTPPMFRNLEDLHVLPHIGWDIRLLLQIILHANDLKSLRITNLYFHGSSDIIARMLSVNPMTKLERMSLEMEMETDLSSRIPRSSLEQLIASCPKLHHLELALNLEQDAHQFMQELCFRVQTQNLDMELDFLDPPESNVDSDDFEDEVLVDE